MGEVAVTVHCDIPYMPGVFYQRELPCLMTVLDLLTLTPGAIIVDGYVDVGDGKPGLGRHLYNLLDEKVAVIGVAKSRFQGADAIDITRGDSSTLLYVTAAGMSPLGRGPGREDHAR